MSIAQQIEEAAAQICDKYCKMPEQWANEHGHSDEDIIFDKFLDEICSNCPLYKLL